MGKGDNRMYDYVIKSEKLSKAYGNNIAINNLSVDINRGGIIGLIGRNGSGKTTFMKMCAGLLNKTEGELYVMGSDPQDNIAVAERLVYAHHNIDYDRNLRLADIVYSFKIMYSNFDEGFALKLLRYFELNPKSKYNSLSQGMMSVFNFICALASRAELTMLDEPVLGMDVAVRKSVYEVLLRDYTEHPRTIIISSHLLSEIEGVLSEILLINKGKLLLYEDIDEIREIAYRADGSKENLDKYGYNKEVIFYKSGSFDSFNIILGSLTEEMVNDAKKQNISLSKVRPEEICMYLTQDNKEAELKCLWEN